MGLYCANEQLLPSVMNNEIDYEMLTSWLLRPMPPWLPPLLFLLPLPLFLGTGIHICSRKHVDYNQARSQSSATNTRHDALTVTRHAFTINHYSEKNRTKFPVRSIPATFRKWSVNLRWRRDYVRRAVNFARQEWRRDIRRYTCCS